MLLVGHIKPWRDSSDRERLDVSNGLAARPSHDVAFDTGLLTVEDDLRISLAALLSEAVRRDELARQYYGRAPCNGRCGCRRRRSSRRYGIWSGIVGTYLRTVTPTGRTFPYRMGWMWRCR
jgi:hypothetical protein